MDSDFIDTLLMQARTLAIYAIDTGQYPRNSRIFKEISTVSQAREKGDIPAVESLIGEMQKLSEEIGVTIEQVMRLATLQGRLRWRAALATPYLIGFMTLILTLYLAFQSSELHKADLSLREYQGMLSERLQEKVYLAWKMYQYDDVINTKAPPLAQLDNYQKLVDDAKRVNERRIAVRTLLLDSAVMRYLPELFQFHGPDVLRQMAQLLNGPLLPGEPTGDRSSPPGPSAGTTSTDQEAAASLAALPQLPTVNNVECADSPLQPSKERQVKAEQKISLNQHDRAFACFLRALHLDSDYDYPMDPLIYATRNKVNLLTSWLLPGLYGLLGACVFLMRRMLDVNGPGKNRARVRVVHLLSLLLRAALGGLAGIIIGWFWVPTASLTASTSAISVSSIPFGIAFLAGFSIDSLFALLEGLIKNFQAKEGKSEGQSLGGRRKGDKPAQPVGAESPAS